LNVLLLLLYHRVVKALIKGTSDNAFFFKFDVNLGIYFDLPTFAIFIIRGRIKISSN